MQMITHHTLQENQQILENISKNLFSWFNDNQLKANAEKSHLILNNDSNCIQ